MRNYRRPQQVTAAGVILRRGPQNAGMGAVSPVLVFDVDGVLNPYAATVCPPGYVEHGLFPGEEPVRLCPAHGAWISELAACFEVAWCTGWGDEANRVLAPILALPPFPVIQVPPAPFAPAAKVPAVAAFVADPPAVWIDDLLTPQARRWADRRSAATLLVDVDPTHGLRRPMIDQALAWASHLSP